MTTIETRLGKITGKKVGSVLGFLGIRYGQSPAGEQRFKPSIAETAWGDQTYDATEFRHSAMQPPPMDFFSDNTVRINTSPSYDEDCLFLNVYVFVSACLCTCVGLLVKVCSHTCFCQRTC